MTPGRFAKKNCNPRIEHENPNEITSGSNYPTTPDYVTLNVGPIFIYTRKISLENSSHEPIYALNLGYENGKYWIYLIRTSFVFTTIHVPFDERSYPLPQQKTKDQKEHTSSLMKTKGVRKAVEEWKPLSQTMESELSDKKSLTWVDINLIEQMIMWFKRERTDIPSVFANRRNASR